MKKLFVLLLATMMLVIPGCVSGVATPGATVLNPYQYSITIQNSTFQTETLKIPPGSTVTWTNKDISNHTVTSLDNVFDSGEIGTGGAFSYRFDKAGSYGYYCKLHFQLNPTLKAQAFIVVE